jgi:acetate kinase
MNILVLNAGSSSQKMSLFKLGDKLPETPRKPDWQVNLSVQWSQMKEGQWLQTMKEQLMQLTSGKDKLLDSLSSIDVVGHRVVHGGKKYLASAKIDDTVKSDIQSFSNLAPLHNEINLEGIFAIEKLLPSSVQQVAVFDTAFHRSIPEATSLYALPYEWFTNYSIHKFGFHGINHQYCAQRAAQIAGKDLSQLGIIVCHLGSGCSLSAVCAGKSLDTTMGFTPLDGLMMSSRCGSVDPGVLIYLLKNTKMSVSELEETLNKRSGLKGISGFTADLAIIIEEMKKGNQSAKLAFDMYTFRIRRSICEMRASLNSFDLLVFTAGVGENAPDVRQSVCQGLEFFDIQLDTKLNRATASDGIISRSDSKVGVLVIKAREDWAIACESWRIASDRVLTA